ncbi:hypothetical protein RZS08_45125, partial [Arthrospira platensis SPKY1]|nr:hypothetical protein [Arthrospira platensis SPKY1]
AVVGGVQAQALTATDGRAALASMGAPAPAALPSAWPGDVVPTIRSGGARPATPSGAAPAATAMPPAQRPALPPNDFQRFVLETSGQALPLFGADLFERPNPYVPADNSPVSPDYRVGPDDELQVRAWGSVDVDVRAVVDRDG